MENVTGRYPWASKDAGNYVEAYRYFVNKCRGYYRQDVYYVWSPVGYPNMHYYWPGNEYVDFVGVSVFSFDEFELDYYGKLKSFEELFLERYQQASKYSKSIIVAESGINGGRERQRKWILGAMEVFHKYPLLKSYIYFNSQDSPEAWGEKYGTPDWHIDPSVFD